MQRWLLASCNLQKLHSASALTSGQTLFCNQRVPRSTHSAHSGRISTVDDSAACSTVKNVSIQALGTEGVAQWGQLYQPLCHVSNLGMLKAYMAVSHGSQAATKDPPVRLGVHTPLKAVQPFLQATQTSGELAVQDVQVSALQPATDATTNSDSRLASIERPVQRKLCMSARACGCSASSSHQNEHATTSRHVTSRHGAHTAGCIMLTLTCGKQAKGTRYMQNIGISLLLLGGVKASSS